MEDLAPDGEEHAGALDALVDRVVARRLGDLVVTPREVDERVTRMADLLALGHNRALQPRLDQGRNSRADALTGGCGACARDAAHRNREGFFRRLSFVPLR